MAAKFPSCINSLIYQAKSGYKILRHLVATSNILIVRQDQL
jgi:hypothetical protein